MTLKGKLLVALLSTTCIATTALGLAACGDKPTAPDYDTTLYSLYQSQTENGTTMSYSQWLTSVFTSPDVGDKGQDGKKGQTGDNGVSVERVTIEENKLVTYYSDGTKYISTYDLSADSGNTCTPVLAVDNKGGVVANAYLTISYYDQTNYVRKTVASGVTDENGLVLFFYNAVEGIKYEVKVADYGATETDNATPDGYAVQDENFYVSTDGSVTKIVFDNVRGTFNNAVRTNAIVQIPYTRQYNFNSSAANPAPIEENGTTNNRFTVDVKSGIYTYLYFNCYVKPSTSEDATETETILENALSAATGQYKITISGGNVTMYYYAGSRANAICDENGIPSIINNYTGDGTSYTTANSITVNNDSTSARGDHIFGIISEKDVTLTITVERIADAKEKPTVIIKEVEPSATASKWPEKSTGETLTLMPVTGAFIPVYNEQDGYYHVNSTTGPILLVQLKNALSRYMEYSLEKYPTSTDFGIAVLQLNGQSASDYDEDGNLLYKYDYNNVVSTYASLANKDGVYGVDKVVYDMLNGLAASAIGVEYSSAKKQYAWMLACQYYAPQGGLTALGSGTSSDPYIIADSSNKVVISSTSAVMKYTATNAGVYYFVTSGATLTAHSSLAQVNAQNRLYVTATTAGQEITLTLTGDAGDYNITVGNATSYSATVGDGLTASVGTTAENAISIQGSNVYNISIDKEATEDGIYITFTPALGTTNATYAFALIAADGQDSSCWIEYDGVKYNANAQSPLEVSELSNNRTSVVTATIKLDCSTSTNFMLWIYAVTNN